MPNRIIKESLLISDDFNELSWFEQSLFVRLIVAADDFGRYDARPKVIKGRLFPLCDGITFAEVDDALLKLSTVGIAELYTVCGRPYVQLKNWGRHQQIRNKKSKFPSPDEADSTCKPLTADADEHDQVQPNEPGCEELQSIDINCNQLISDDSNCPRNPIQSESESNNIYTAAVRQVVDRLNEVCGTNYRPSTAATRKHIQARLREGFTVENFYRVIDKKAAQWRGTDMAKYLRPETLFGSKFESYLQERPEASQKKFVNFNERRYDYDELERQLLAAQEG